MGLSQILKSIRRKNSFEVLTEDGSLYIKIEQYSSHICTAIHNGQNLRASLKKKIGLSDEERFKEEDPYTERFISSQPIVIVVNDSRYEYDVNRSPDKAIYEEAWGKKVWKKELTSLDKKRSLKKHENFYKILKELTSVIEKDFGYCVIFDVHSYNEERTPDVTSLFNVGDYYLSEANKEEALHWVKELNDCKFSSLSGGACLNEAFQGRGYLSEFCATNCNQTIALPTEIQKKYLDQKTGQEYPSIVEAIHVEFKSAIVRYLSSFFERKGTKNSVNVMKSVLPSVVEEVALQVDVKLNRLIKNFDILRYINPINFSEEKKKFFKLKFNYEPDFMYKGLPIDTRQMKERLYRLPVDKIKDITIRRVYRKIVDYWADQVDLIASLGKTEFVYNSLRVHGEPSVADVENAKFLMYAPDIIGEREQLHDVQHAYDYFLSYAKEFGFPYKAKVTSRIVAGAMADNKELSVLINKNESFSENRLRSLLFHEVGVHLLTTVNAKEQSLKIFETGFPNNVETQEGLAILSEYLSGTMDIKRLKELACRVLAVRYMLDGMSFSQSFKALHEGYHMDKELAFKTVGRVFRGGGYTKDYLYLSGFKQVLLIHRQNPQKIATLCTGKTSYEFMEEYDELLERQILVAPKYQNPIFSNAEASGEVIQYLITSIK